MKKLLLSLGASVLTFGAVQNCGLQNTNSKSQVKGWDAPGCVDFSGMDAEIIYSTTGTRLSDGSSPLSPLNFGQDPNLAKRGLAIVQRQKAVAYCSFGDLSFFLSAPNTDPVPPKNGERCFKLKLETLSVKTSNSKYAIYNRGIAIWRSADKDDAETLLSVLKDKQITSVCRLGANDSAEALVYLTRSKADTPRPPQHNTPHPTPVPTATNNQPVNTASVKIEARDAEVSHGNKTELSWEAKNVTQCAIKGETVSYPYSHFEVGRGLSSYGGTLITPVIQGDTIFTIECELLSSQPQKASASVRVALANDLPLCSTGFERYNGRCVESCRAGETRHNTTGLCISVSCQGGFEPFRGDCRIKCEEGWVRDYEGDCTRCYPHEEVFNGHCTARCPRGTFRNIYGNCGVCLAGREVVGNECLPLCPQGTRRNSFGNCVL